MEQPAVHLRRDPLPGVLRRGVEHRGPRAVLGAARVLGHLDRVDRLALHGLADRHQLGQPRVVLRDLDQLVPDARPARCRSRKTVEPAGLRPSAATPVWPSTLFSFSGTPARPAWPPGRGWRRPRPRSCHRRPARALMSSRSRPAPLSRRAAGGQLTDVDGRSCWPAGCGAAGAATGRHHGHGQSGRDGQSAEDADGRMTTRMSGPSQSPRPSRARQRAHPTPRPVPCHDPVQRHLRTAHPDHGPASNPAVRMRA